MKIPAHGMDCFKFPLQKNGTFIQSLSCKKDCRGWRKIPEHHPIRNQTRGLLRPPYRMHFRITLLQIQLISPTKAWIQQYHSHKSITNFQSTHLLLPEPKDEQLTVLSLPPSPIWKTQSPFTSS